MSDSSTPVLPIRTVSAETGVNSVTLRAWERRYGLIVPRRTESGHRLYSQDDVDRIKRIVDLLDQGVSLSQIRNLLDGASQVPTNIASTSNWDELIDAMIDAIAAFDDQKLTQIYTSAMGTYPVELVNRRLIIPTLERVGDRWASGQGTVAEEHFFQVFFRDKLGARIHHHARRGPGPELLTACMPGEHHDLGLLFFVVQALDRGMRVVNLGANTPLEDLPSVITRRAFEGVVLAANYGVDAGAFGAALPKMVSEVGIPVFLGGRQAAEHAEEIEAAGAILLGDRLHEGFGMLNEHLRGS